jgi:hypothetical protein
MSDIDVSVDIIAPCSIDASVEIDGDLYIYDQLLNKPKINDVELQGNKTLEELGIERISTKTIDDMLRGYDG